MTVVNFDVWKKHVQKQMLCESILILTKRIYQQEPSLVINARKKMDAVFFQGFDLANIIIEAIEVLLNHILYLRDLYPQRIFKKCRFYNAPVYVSTFPDLNSYIHNVLRAARELQQRKALQSVSLHFYHDELPTNECYTIEIKQLQPTIDIEEQLETEPKLLSNDKFFIDFEEQMRAFLYNVSERLKTLSKLPKGAKFRIAVNTTQEAFVRFSHNSHYQDFPLLCGSLSAKAEEKTTTLLPLTHLNTIGVKLSLVQFS